MVPSIWLKHQCVEGYFHGKVKNNALSIKNGHARVDGVYAVPYGSMDRFVGAFGDCGGSKDKHVEVEE